MTRSLRMLAGRLGLRPRDGNGDGVTTASSSFSSPLLLDNCFLTEGDSGLGQSSRTLQQVRFGREDILLRTLSQHSYYV